MLFVRKSSATKSALLAFLSGKKAQLKMTTDKAAEDKDDDDDDDIEQVNDIEMQVDERYISL